MIGMDNMNVARFRNPVNKLLHPMAGAPPNLPNTLSQTHYLKITFCTQQPLHLSLLSNQANNSKKKKENPPAEHHSGKATVK